MGGHWHEIDAPVTEGALHAVAEALAAGGIPGRYLESDAGELALLVPARALTTSGDIRLADPQPEGLFVDPPTGTAAASALAELDDPGRPVRVALPEDADPTGLVADAGSVTIGSAGSGSAGSGGRYRLYRVDRQTPDPQTPDWGTPPQSARLGEQEGSLDARERWFRARE